MICAVREPRRPELDKTANEYNIQYQDGELMVLCLCKAVTDAAVRQVIEDGATSVDEIGARCGAGTDCGGCRGSLADLVAADAHACAGNCSDCPRRRAHLYSPSHALGEAA
jgi:bacterioferritin-associated ferredoxin